MPRYEARSWSANSTDPGSGGAPCLAVPRLRSRPGRPCATPTAVERRRSGLETERSVDAPHRDPQRLAVPRRSRADSLRADAVALVSDGIELTHRRRRTRGLLTVFGLATAVRMSYGARRHPSLNPLDAALNLPDGAVLSWFEAGGGYRSSSGSFDATVEAIERSTGTKSLYSQYWCVPESVSTFAAGAIKPGNSVSKSLATSTPVARGGGAGFKSAWATATFDVQNAPDDDRPGRQGSTARTGVTARRRTQPGGQGYCIHRTIVLLFRLRLLTRPQRSRRPP